MNRPLADVEEIRDLAKRRIEQEETEIGQQQKQSEKTTAFTSKEIFQALFDNEDGDARLYIKIHKGRHCFDHSVSRWYVYHKHFWKEDIIEQTTASIQKVIDAYALEAQRQAFARLGAEKVGKKETANSHKAKEEALFKRIRTLQTKKRKENILHLAKVGENSLGTTGSQWDRDLMSLGCLNGVIDLKTGEHLPGKPEDYIKTFAQTEWKGLNAPCPTWEKFLEEVFIEKELIDYIQRLLGYGITGKTISHIIVILWGIGRNGKGTLLETLKFVLGNLVYKAESELLLDQRFQRISGAPNSGILALRGKRLVYVSETSEGRQLNTSRIKELVGGDTLNARALYAKHHVEFQPTHLLLLLTNHKPHAPAGDYALWQRVNLIPFTLSFVNNPEKINERQADPNLPDKLKDEAPGILAWLVRGCLEWQRQGLNSPEIVTAATKAYRREEDLIGHFIADRCVVEKNIQVKAGELYHEYKAWAESMGHKRMSGTRFGKEMKERFDSYKTNYTFYTGIGLLQE